jgi:MoxR-like ATPase
MPRKRRDARREHESKRHCGAIPARTKEENMSLNEKMLAVTTDLGGLVAEREELIEAIAVALLTRKNLFILGDTGQAKSHVVNEFRKRVVGAKQFERLLSKQTDEEQLFGRIDLASVIPGNPDPKALSNDREYRECLAEVVAAKENGEEGKMEGLLRRLDTIGKAVYALCGNRPRLVTAGKIPESHIVFLDEIFKANDGVLNSLLTALNERRFTNEGETADIPVISFFAASNEIPDFKNAEDAILKPLYDRLELKIVTEYVESRDARLRVLKQKQAGASAAPQCAIGLEELFAMQEEVRNVAVPEALNELMDDIMCELREKGMHVSDRKYFGYYPLVKAFAWLRGRTVAEAGDLLILRHYHWTDPGERESVRQILERKCVNPLKETLEDMLKMAAESYGDFAADTDADMTKKFGKLRNEFIGLYESISDLSRKYPADDEKDLMAEAVRRLEEYSKKAHKAAQFTYAPLDELLALKKTA